MPPALLTLIALTVVAFGLIVALLLKIRADRIAVQPVFGTLGGIDRRSNSYWRNRALEDSELGGSVGLVNEQGLSEAKAEADE